MSERIVRLSMGDTAANARLMYGRDNRESLRELPPSSVHCCITSPPYHGLRDYGAEGQIGLEGSPDEYVAALVDVFREVKRVLRPDGTLWLNLGDNYAQCEFSHLVDGVTSRSYGMKEKDLVGIPWRVAFALREDGWYFRSACPWIKRNVMPLPLRDRPTSAVEYMFLFAHPDSKGVYYYDIDGTRTVTDAGDAGRNRRDSDWFFEGLQHTVYEAQHVLQGGETLMHSDEGEPQAFVVNPRGYTGSHFATFPHALVEPCVRAGTSAHGVCPSCGTPWSRIRVETERASGSRAVPTEGGWGRTNTHLGITVPNRKRTPISTQWEAGCKCGGEPVPSTVLDPFSGAATVGAVALRQNRHYIGLDVNPAFMEVAEARIMQAPPPPRAGVTPGDARDVGGGVLDMFGGDDE